MLGAEAVLQAGDGMRTTGASGKHEVLMEMLYRFMIPLETNTESRRMLLASKEWPLRVTSKLRLTSASRILSTAVRHQCLILGLVKAMLILRITGSRVGLSRQIELDVDIGADARDWSAIQAAEKLKPVEIELKRIEEVVGEIVTQMEYLRRREQKLRDTNESTNERVKWFAVTVMMTLIALGAWQVVYLRAYFRSKHLI